MKLTEDEVLHVLRLLDESSFDELELQMGELQLRVRRRDAPSRPGPSVAAEPARPAARVAGADSPPAAPAAAAAPEAAEAAEAGLLPVKAPMVGTFFARPSPNEPPFVEAGAHLEAETTVCLLEVMKVFNTVKAGVRGRVVRACVQNGEFVEYGQTLFLVQPDDDAGAAREP